MQSQLEILLLLKIVIQFSRQSTSQSNTGSILLNKQKLVQTETEFNIHLNFRRTNCEVASKRKITLILEITNIQIL